MEILNIFKREPALILGLLISWVTAIILSVFFGFDNFQSSIVGLLGSLLTLSLNIFLTMNKNHEFLLDNLAISKYLFEEPKLQSTIYDIVEAHKTIKHEICNKQFLQPLELKLEDCKISFSELREGRFRLVNISECNKQLKSIRDANERVRGISMNVEKMWKSNFGKEYSNINRMLIQKGVKICRVFVIPESKLGEIEPLIHEQIDDGLHVNILFLENVKYEGLKDITLIDDGVSIVLESYVDGQLKDGCVYHYSYIKKYEDMFNYAWDNSINAKDLLNYGN